MATTVRPAFTLRWSEAKCRAVAASVGTAPRRATVIGSKKTRYLSWCSSSKHADLPHVPSLVELATTPQDRQLAELMLAPLEMGRPFFAPPGVPADRVQILRRAFDATAKDPEFLADVEKQKVELVPISGGAVEALVRRIYATP